MSYKPNSSPLYLIDDRHSIHESEGGVSREEEALFRGTEEAQQILFAA